MGADCPRSKNVFLRAPGSTTIGGQVGGQVPLSGWTPKVPDPPNFKSTFFELGVQDFPQTLNGGDPIAEVYLVQIWAKSQFQKSRKTSHSFYGFGDMWAKVHQLAGN